jgi:hypothetical protein
MVPARFIIEFEVILLKSTASYRIQMIKDQVNTTHLRHLIIRDLFGSKNHNHYPQPTNALIILIPSRHHLVIYFSQYYHQIPKKNCCP